MSTDPIADLVDHPPRDDRPAPPALVDAVLARVRSEASPRPTVWWPLVAAVAAGLLLLPGGDGEFSLDLSLLGPAIECLLAAGAVLLLARLAARPASEATWTA
jgi:lysylphosphatidylglycerol synthetase-like protein (DUF2156 family)